MRIELPSGTPAELALPVSVGSRHSFARGVALSPDIMGLRPLFDGLCALKAAGTGTFDRAVAFYGMIRVPEAWQGPGHGEPLDAVARPGACPVLAVIGERDPYTPPSDVELLEQLPNVTTARYPEAE